MDVQCSVGANGVNRRADTKNVQFMFNISRMLNAQLGQMTENLDMDGKCGPKTIEAIRDFQNVCLRWARAYCDGVVDPGGKTIAALNGNIAGASRTAVVPVAGNVAEGTGNGVAAAASSGDYTAYRQGDYKGHTLGSGTLSVSGYGCALCTLTMAATSVGSRTKHWPADLQPSALDPLKANDIVKKGGGFSNSLLIMGTAAAALGMNYEEYGRSSNLGPTDLTRLSTHVAGGKPVAAHVDYKKGASGDHWILITTKNGDGSYKAIDPATGKRCTLRAPAAEVENLRLKDRASTEKTGILAGWPDGGGSANQQKYNVVRFALLSRKATV